MVKKILIAVAVVIVLFLAFFMFGSYSDGYRAGTVTKLSKKGFIIKTYEGELNTGALAGGMGRGE